jgi:hypothetical protein
MPQISNPHSPKYPIREGKTETELYVWRRRVDTSFQPAGCLDLSPDSLLQSSTLSDPIPPLTKLVRRSGGQPTGSACACASTDGIL